VWGCADNTARKWWAEGCRSLNDVRNKATGLTAIQQMGLKYYDDFEQRIPRDEVTEAVSIIRDTVLDVLQVRPLSSADIVE
jgi:DNA polymerase lambda